MKDNNIEIYSSRCTEKISGIKYPVKLDTKDFSFEKEKIYYNNINKLFTLDRDLCLKFNLNGNYKFQFIIF